MIYDSYLLIQPRQQIIRMKIIIRPVLNLFRIRVVQKTNRDVVFCVLYFVLSVLNIIMKLFCIQNTDVLL